MRYIKDIKDGDQLNGIYYCKEKKELRSKNDKPYYSLILQDKTGSLDGKVWDTNSNGIEDFAGGDFICVQGQISVFMGALQGKIIRARRCNEGEYDLADYIPTSRYNRDEMYKELLAIIDTVQLPYYRKLLDSFFRDKVFEEKFKNHSAAKTVHHSFVGGLLEHSLGVVKVCDFMSKQYPMLNRDLLITAAPLHDIGKMVELSGFPTNEYTDAGQLLGHIYIGANMVSEKINKIEDFPKRQADELIHCILSHHGSLEFGSPKMPSLMEAFALSLADNMDAKMETFTELLEVNEGRTDWLGYNKLFESNIRIATKNKE